MDNKNKVNGINILEDDINIVEDIENTDSNALKGKVLDFIISVCDFVFSINQRSKASFYNLQDKRDKLIATFYDFDIVNKKEKIRCFKAENKIRALFDDVKDRFNHVQELRKAFSAQFLSNSPSSFREMIIEKHIKPFIVFLLSEYQLNINMKF